MTRWFRWYEGTCEDGKFRTVARNANVTVATVMGVWAVLLEDASNGEQRGVAERGFAFYAAVLDLSEEDILRILNAMNSMKMVDGGPEKFEITKWKERQFETDAADNTNADRQRRWRERNKANAKITDRNGTVTEAKRPDTDTDTDTENKDAAPNGAQVVPLPQTPEKIFFDQAVQFLGQDARSLAAKLLKAKAGNVLAAHQALLTAAQKSNAREYIGAIIRGRDSIEDLRARGEAW